MKPKSGMCCADVSTRRETQPCTCKDGFFFIKKRKKMCANIENGD